MSINHLACPSLDALTKERILEHYIYLGDEREAEAGSKARNGHPVFHRALHGFVLLKNGEPDFVQPFDIQDQYWNEVTVLGYAATLEGDEGLVVQTGHWLGSRVGSHLVKIDRIQNLEWCSDPKFRSGEPCLWLSAGEYRYAMMSPLTFFESLWHLTLAGYLASPWELTSLSHDHPVWWPKQHESVWATLQDAERFAALPAVRRKVLANNTWHYPGLPAHSSRPILCPPSIPSDPSRDPTGRKRALDNAHTPDVPSSEPAGDREPRFNVKRFCLEDPNRLTHVMRRALAISESPRDLMEVDEATKTQPGVVCCLGNGYEDVWVLGQPNAPNASAKSKGGKNTKAAPSRC